MKQCVLCHHAVSLGDRHSALNCPPPAGKTGDHERRKRLLKKARKRAAADEAMSHRGVAVAGIHKKRGGESK